MILTFAQYSILTATYTCATYSQLEQKTHFDRLMIQYYILGLLNIGLIRASDQVPSETTCYELTDMGLAYIEDYERANPALIIKHLSN
jgi:predicted transcriptional regulator